jgi:hypothetical protein
MTRKELLNSTIVAAGTTILFPQGRLLSASSTNCNLTEETREIINLAFRSPSSHNSQPWYIKIVNKSQWELGLVSDRFLPAVDPAHREAALSLGCLVESTILSLEAHGSKGEVTEIDSLKKKVTISHKGGQKNDTSLGENLAARMTVRKNFEKKDLSSRDRTVLERGIRDIHYYTLSSDMGQNLSEATVKSNILQVNRTETQVELAKWIHWNKKDAAHYRNGLTPATMEIPSIARLFIRNYTEKDVLSQGFKKATIDLIKEQVHAGAGWYLLYSKNNSFPHLIDAGQRYFRLLSRIRPLGIAMHPMSQLLEESEMIPVKTAVTPGGKELQFVIRTGYRNYPSEPQSMRMHLTKTVLQ